MQLKRPAVFLTSQEHRPALEISYGVDSRRLLGPGLFHALQFRPDFGYVDVALRRGLQNSVKSLARHQRAILHRY